MSLDFSRRSAFAVIALSICLGLLSTPAQAQYEPNFELSVQGGYDRTFSVLKDFAEDGFAAGASLGYRFTDRLVLGGDLQFHSFHPNDSVTAPFGGNIEISSTMVEYAGFAKLYLNDGKRRLYARGSAGLFHGRTEITYLGVQMAGTSDDPGMSGALGLELFGRNNSATFFEASYRRLIGEDIHWVSFSVGASFFIW